jgi:hypothetical protein
VNSARVFGELRADFDLKSSAFDYELGWVVGTCTRETVPLTCISPFAICGGPNSLESNWVERPRSCGCGLPPRPRDAGHISGLGRYATHTHGVTRGVARDRGNDR